MTSSSIVNDFSYFKEFALPCLLSPNTLKIKRFRTPAIPLSFHRNNTIITIYDTLPNLPQDHNLIRETLPTASAMVEIDY
jgi:hypothetical protein